jgi:drug/metabolite transporter (DMT)-like permease
MTATLAPARPGLANWLRVIALSIIWGASFMNVKIALTGFGPFTIAALRITIAAVALTAIARVMGQSLPRSRRIWAHAVGFGFFSNALPFSLLGFGQQHVASGFAGITMAAVPLFTLLLAARFVPGERLTLPKIVGLGLGIAGVATLIGPRALATSGAELETLARLACVASTLSYATGAIITRRCPPVPMIAFSAAGLLAAGVMILPVALIHDGWPHFAAAGPLAIASVLYLGLFPTALATLLLVTVIQSAGPTFLTQSNYQVPLWSVLFGTVLMGERLPASFLAALVLILAGLAITNAPIWRNKT